MKKATFYPVLIAVAVLSLLACSKDIDDFSSEEIARTLDNRHKNDLLEMGYLGKVKSVEYATFRQASWDAAKGTVDKKSVSQKNIQLFDESGYCTSSSDFYSIPTSMTFEKISDGNYIGKVVTTELKNFSTTQYKYDSNHRVVEVLATHEGYYYVIKGSNGNEYQMGLNSEVGEQVDLSNFGSSTPTGELIQRNLSYQKAVFTYNFEKKIATATQSYSENNIDFDESFLVKYDLDEHGYINWDSYSIYYKKSQQAFEDAPSRSYKDVVVKDAVGNTLVSYAKFQTSDEVYISSYIENVFTYY